MRFDSALRASDIIVESFNNGARMATVNFSVPDDVKKAFDRAFKDQNKSAVIAELMRRAVTEAERNKRRVELFRRLTDDRRRRPKIADQTARRVRSAGRP
jgi:hypothetical protein